ncbi:YoaK family protein [Asticcacaulis sp.]|uniref:YoaK family protein n=1 Tax=Asticcacaulis sp. TaxID=1872648 RepID=UPI002B834943|nr:YoaK family protein [Asticcacaulis sp.]HTM82803.1 YoaK family protein [Asticcacaulis sp.]
MLVGQGSARNFASDQWLACTLAGVAGALNAAAFNALGFFSANMTGNVSALSDHLAMGQIGSASVYAAIVVAFVFGAFCSTLLISRGHHSGFTGIYALVILVESVGMAILGGTQVWLNPELRNAFMIFGLAYLMGLQNAVVTRISDARVRTTHVSGMATDIGIEMGLLIDAAVKPRSAAETAAIGARLRLHLQTIIAFLVGGLAGVALYHFIGGGVFWIAAGVLGVISVHGLHKARHVSPPPAPPEANDL